MKLIYKIDHSALALLIGDAKNSKSFSDRAWGSISYESLCERFYNMYSTRREIPIEEIAKIINELKIEKKESFDNFALDYIEANLKGNSNIA